MISPKKSVQVTGMMPEYFLSDILLLISKIQLKIEIYKSHSQCAEMIVNRIIKSVKETYTGWKSMTQGFRIYFPRNPRLKGMMSNNEIFFQSIGSLNTHGCILNHALIPYLKKIMFRKSELAYKLLSNHASLKKAGTKV